MAEKSDPEARQKAIEYLKKAVELSPNMIDALKRLAVLLIQENRHKEAIGYLDRVVSLKTADSQELYSLARCILQSGPEDPANWQKARPILEKAVAINPKYENAQLDLGIILLKQGDAQAGIGRFRKVLEINPQNQQARELLKQLN